MEKKDIFINIINECFSKYKNNIAIIFQPQENYYYYNDLSKDSDLILKELLKLGIKNQYIGILNDNNIPFIPIIIGILKANIAFVFINEETDILIDKLKIKWIFTKSNHTFQRNDIKSDLSIKLKFGEIRIWSIHQTNLYNKDPNIIYAIKTSGSTGNPKVIQVTYDCIVPNILDLRRDFKISADDVIALASPLTFDPSVVEIFLSLVSGARLLIISPRFINCTIDYLFPKDKMYSLTFLQITPSIFINLPSNIRFSILNSESTVRNLIFGGEPFPNLKLLRNWKHIENKTNIYNIYGITEISCWSSLVQWDLKMNRISIGKPLSDTEFIICDDKGNEIHENNCKGELWITSNKRLCIIDEEYLNGSLQNIKIRTGDIVEKLENAYYYLCRKDDIIKRFGHRVNLLNIKEIVTSYSEVENAECIWDSEHRNLILYITPANLDIDNVRTKLTRDLTFHHFPDEIIALSKLPLSSHGKISKKNLNYNHIDRFKILCEKYLGNQLDWNLSFSASGGNSIQILQVIQEMKNSPPNLLGRLLSNDSLMNCIKYLESIDKDSTFIKQKKTKILSKNLSYPKIELKILWKFNLGKCIDATPAIFEINSSNYNLIIGSHSHKLAILTGENDLMINAKVISLSDRIEATTCISKCGQYCFIGSYDCHMYCISTKNGKIIWKFKTENIIKSKAVITNSGEFLIFGSYDNYIYSLEVQRGILKWKIKQQGGLFASICLVDSNNTAVSVSLEGKVINFDQNNGQINWTKLLSNPVFSTPHHINNFILIAQVNGEILALDERNAEMIWMFKASNNLFSSFTTIEEEFIIFGCHDSCVYCVRISNGTLEWQIKLDSPIFATPSIYSYKDSSPYIVVASTKGFVYILDSINGFIISRYELNGELFSSPIVFSNKIFIGSRDDYIYCLNLNFTS